MQKKHIEQLARFAAHWTHNRITHALTQERLHAQKEHDRLVRKRQAAQAEEHRQQRELEAKAEAEQVARVRPCHACAPAQCAWHA